MDFQKDNKMNDQSELSSRDSTMRLPQGTISDVGGPSPASAGASGHQWYSGSMLGPTAARHPWKTPFHDISESLGEVGTCRGLC